eukprot:1104489-Amphidinium_carterae.1
MPISTAKRCKSAVDISGKPFKAFHFNRLCADGLFNTRAPSAFRLLASNGGGKHSTSATIHSSGCTMLSTITDSRSTGTGHTSEEDCL